MHWGARVFVLAVFTLLGLSFVATTATLAYEFRDAQWVDFLTLDSHLFLFFPTFGIAALAAFYTPACAFLDLYWRHIPYGKLRFLVGFLVLCVLSYAIAGFILASPKHPAWEIAPPVLLADAGEPAGCARTVKGCERMPYLEALSNLRTVSRSRIGLAVFARDCKSDPLVDELPVPSPKRFCFASTPLTAQPALQADHECCQAQQRLENMVTMAFAHEDQRSLTYRVHSLLLPLKIMLLLILLAISLLLALRFRNVETHYRRYISRIERGLVVGAAAAMFFPFMSQGFLESSAALVGINARGTFSTIVPVMSVVFGIWLLVIVFYFYRRRDKQLELIGKLGGAVAGAFAALKYNFIVSFFVRFLGSGANTYVIGGLIFLSLVALVAVAWPSKSDLDFAGDIGDDASGSLPPAGEQADWPAPAPADASATASGLHDAATGR